MRKILLILFMALAIVCEGQMQRKAAQYSTQKNRVSLSDTLLSTTIELNANYRNWIRDDQSVDFYIKAPLGFSVSWEWEKSNNPGYTITSGDISATTGSTKRVNVTFGNYVVDSELCVSYDLIVTATSAPPWAANTFKIQKRFRRAMTVMPPLFTEGEADEVWNAGTDGSIDYNYNLADKTGWKIFVKGSKNKTGDAGANTVDWNTYISFWRLRSLDITQPVHILFDPSAQFVQEIRNNSRLGLDLAWDCQNVVVDALGNGTHEYGYRIQYSDLVTQGSGGQAIYVRHMNSTTTSTYASKNVVVAGIQVEGNDRASALLSVQPQSGTAAVTKTSWASGGYQEFRGFKFFNLDMQNSYDEGLYINRFTTTTDYPGLAYSYFYNIRADHSGNEALQISTMYASEFHDNSFKSSNWKNGASHNNLLQIVGCTNTAVFRNTLEGDCDQIASFFIEDAQNVAVFANVFKNLDASGSGFFMRADDRAAPNTVNYHIMRNTIYAPNRTGTMFYWQRNTGSTTVQMDDYGMEQNIVIGGSGSSRWGAINSPSYTNIFGVAQSPNTSNPFYFTTNTSLPEFVNISSINFKHADAANDAYLANLSYSSLPSWSMGNSPVADLIKEDKDGVLFESTDADYSLQTRWLTKQIGAYSGYEHHMATLANEPNPNPVVTTSEITTTTAKINVSSINARTYYIVQLASVGAPSQAQILAGQNGNGVAALASGIIYGASPTVSGLSTGQAYEIYTVSESILSGYYGDVQVTNFSSL